jgi:transglutaminase-like putative cysteine protease
MSAAPPWHPHPQHWWGLGLALGLSAAPHLLRLPLWLSALWVVAVVWRVSLGLHGKDAPALPVRLLLTLAAGAGLLLHFGTVLGREAGSALLVMMVGLKLLELKRARDAVLLVLLCYLLLAVQFMFDQSVIQVVYVLVTVAVVTAVWVELGNPLGTGRWRADLGLAARMLAQALPLMLILFVLFPRLPGPLWSLPADAHSARSGLGGEMEPGRISQLALSEAVAFRADFAGPLPPPAQRYWRGPVFELTDGLRWSPAPAETSTDAERGRPAFTTSGTVYRYTMTLEPSGAPWLPALEMTTTVPEDASRLATLELKARRDVNTLRRDAHVAFTDYRIDTPGPAALRRNLYVPERLSQRVRHLARSWREAADDDRAVVDAALRHFNTEAFVYTLEPPLLEGDPVDAFLFETRRGFCEHYAAAFTLLMRAAGIPARVVTGYQGGEVNTVGGYLVVRQSDAHAWAEVWLDGRGWSRIDPTAAVAPERIERRIDVGRRQAGAAVAYALDETGLLGASVRRARFALDALNNGWNQWVLNYGPQRQRDLLAGLGLRALDWRGLAWVLALSFGTALCVLALALLWRRPARRDPVMRLYARFTRRLARQGVVARPAEGPRDLLARIEHAGLPAADAARRVIELYVGLRYAPEPDPRRLRELRRAVRAL